MRVDNDLLAPETTPKVAVVFEIFSRVESQRRDAAIAARLRVIEIINLLIALVLIFPIGHQITTDMPLNTRSGQVATFAVHPLRNCSDFLADTPL